VRHSPQPIIQNGTDQHTGTSDLLLLGLTNIPTVAGRLLSAGA